MRRVVARGKAEHRFSAELVGQCPHVSLIDVWRIADDQVVAHRAEIVEEIRLNGAHTRTEAVAVYIDTRHL